MQAGISISKFRAHSTKFQVDDELEKKKREKKEKKRAQPAAQTKQANSLEQEAEGLIRPSSKSNKEQAGSTGSSQQPAGMNRKQLAAQQLATCNLPA